MTRSGPIRPEEAEERLDRRKEVLPLWERGEGANVDLPWTETSRFDAADLQPLMASARNATLVLGATETSRALREAVFQSVLHSPDASCRLYVYGDRDLEPELAPALEQKGFGDRALVRLGHRPPADWLVVDGGRDGRLVMGATAGRRRWVIPVDRALARSLFETFRVLFWFHAEREALPDAAGSVAFHPPLPAPFDAPETGVALAAGRLRLDGGSLDDPVPDAEIRVSPNASDPGRAGVLFVPPAEGMVSDGDVGPVIIDLPMELASRGHRVLWTDTGLPRTAVTRQRMVVDLVEPPIALQLEWPRAKAIEIFHQLDRAVQHPTWEFHPQRRLGDIKGEVLTTGARQPAKIVQSIALEADDLDAPLTDFDAARPEPLPDIPPLALEAVFQWRRVPTAVPPGARPAEIVRGWTAVDEWASRRTGILRDILRKTLDELESPQGLSSLLRRWLPSRSGDTLVSKCKQLRYEVDEVGESPPSQVPEETPALLERLARITSTLDELRRNARDQWQAAEEAQAKEQQRERWEMRRAAAEAELKDVREKLVANEQAHGKATERLQAAQKALDAVVTTKRRERQASLERERTELDEQLQAAHARRKSLDADSKGLPSKAARKERKETNRRVSNAEKAVGRNKRERESIAAWSPPKAVLGDASTQLDEAKKAVSDLQSGAYGLSEKIRELERTASETFRFDPPPKLPAPSGNEADSDPPPIPLEAPPELGDLYEHQGRRYLAIRTWEQLEPAQPVAKRLGAELVAAPPRSVE